MKDPRQKQRLPTTKASFIEKARQQVELFICQPYELYKEDNQEAWRRLYKIGRVIHAKY